MLFFNHHFRPLVVVFEITSNSHFMRCSFQHTVDIKDHVAHPGVFYIIGPRLPILIKIKAQNLMTERHKSLKPLLKSYLIVTSYVIRSDDSWCDQVNCTSSSCCIPLDSTCGRCSKTSDTQTPSRTVRPYVSYHQQQLWRRQLDSTVYER